MPSLLSRALAHTQPLTPSPMHEMLVQGVTHLTLTYLRLQVPKKARATLEPLFYGRHMAWDEQARTCHCAAMEPLGRCARVAM